MTEARQGHRGYVGSRPYFGERAPQHVQNLVIRDYCRRLGLHYLLSAAEYTMQNCFLVLEQALDELPCLNGIVLYSVFMLPRRQEHRLAIYRRILAAGADLHGAVEGILVASEEDVVRLEETWRTRRLLPFDRHHDQS